MKKTARALVLAVALAFAGSATFSSTASAQPAGTAPSGGGAGLGIGAAAFLGGVAGAQVVYDMPLWHIEGILGFDSRDSNTGNNAPNRTDTQVGVRGWYHLRQGASADFSIGGGIGFHHVSVTGGSGTETLVEPGAQARVFLTPNFALFGLVGFSLNFGDTFGRASGIELTGQTNAGFGFTYYFR